MGADYFTNDQGRFVIEIRGRFGNVIERIEVEEKPNTGIYVDLIEGVER